MLVLQHLQYAVAEAGNVKNINISQYAVLLANVGGVNCDDGCLKEFGRRYGDVVAAFHVRDLGRFLAPNMQVCPPCVMRTAALSGYGAAHRPPAAWWERPRLHRGAPVRRSVPPRTWEPQPMQRV